MKTSFIPNKGKVFHAIHETRSEVLGGCHTICGIYFDRGRRSEHSVTCRKCVERESPLKLSDLQRSWFHVYVQRKQPMRDTAGLWRKDLVDMDFITRDDLVTRRGEVLARDWSDGPVPMADAGGIVHERLPLSAIAKCRAITDIPDMLSVAAYEKLRSANEESPALVTCIRCLALNVDPWKT